MMSKIKSMASRIKETSRYAWKRLRNLKRKIWLYEKYNIYIRKLPDDNLSDENYSFNKDIHFKLATLEDIPFVANQFFSHFGNNGEELLSNRLSDGEFLIIGYLNNDLQSICFLSWLSHTDIFFHNAMQAKKTENAICSHGTLVPSTFRKKGIGKISFFFIENIAINLGYHQIWGFVRINNIASKKMVENHDWKIQGELVRLIIFNHQYLKILRKGYFK